MGYGTQTHTTGVRLRDRSRPITWSGQNGHYLATQDWCQTSWHDAMSDVTSRHTCRM